MRGRYLIPANASRGKLIFSYFRVVDLIIFLVGLSITFILMMIFQGKMGNIWVSVSLLIPAGICTFLVMPIPNHHNVLVFLQEMYRFYTTNQRYLWKGWCFYNGKEKGQ